MAGDHLDACLRVVGHRYRRGLIRELRQDREGATTIDTLVEYDTVDGIVHYLPDRTVETLLDVLPHDAESLS